jgi:ElaB/YqjD/DUF883 family membrane-anchored ribosome-binding protein
MTRDEIALVRARRESEASRARLTGTLIELQNRLKPKALIEDALEDIREKADELAEQAIETVRRRPFASAAVVLAVLAWLFRAPILSAIGNMLGMNGKETEESD